MKFITKIVCGIANSSQILEYTKNNNYNLTLNEITMLTNSICDKNNVEDINEFFHSIKGLSSSNKSRLLHNLFDIENIDIIINDFSLQELDSSIISDITNNIIDCEEYLRYKKPYTKDSYLAKYINRNFYNLSSSDINKILDIEHTKTILALSKVSIIRNNKDYMKQLTKNMCKFNETYVYENANENLKKDIEKDVFDFYKGCTQEKNKDIIFSKAIPKCKDANNMVDFLLDKDSCLSEEKQTKMIEYLVNTHDLCAINNFISLYEEATDLTKSDFNIIIDYLLSLKIDDSVYNILDSIYNKLDEENKKKVGKYIIDSDEFKYIKLFALNNDSSILFLKDNPKFRSVEEFMNYIRENERNWHAYQDNIESICNPKIYKKNIKNDI